MVKFSNFIEINKKPWKKGMAWLLDNLKLEQEFRELRLLLIELVT